MICLKQAVIVEGKYDKIRLSNFVKAEIITTDGFRIFKDKQKRELIRKIAEKRGVIVLTDSDSAGFMIRGHLAGITDPKNITNVFIPEIKGKERRKSTRSKQGLLGVEGLSEQIITEAFLKAGIDVCNGEITAVEPKITRADLYEMGLLGKDNSSQKRRELEEKLGLPKGMSVSQLLTVLNLLYTEDENLNGRAEN